MEYPKFRLKVGLNTTLVVLFALSWQHFVHVSYTHLTLPTKRIV